MNILSRLGRSLRRGYVAQAQIIELLERRVLLSQATGFIHSTDRFYYAATSAVVVGEQVLLSGDSDGDFPSGNSEVDIYDAATHRWSTAALSVARDGKATASVDGLALFAGGTIGFFDTQMSAVVDIYHSPTGTWTTANLSQARAGMAAVTVGDEVVFAGGYIVTESPPSSGSQSTPSSAVDIYDAATDQWSASTLPQAESDLQAAGAVDGNAVFYDQSTGEIFTFDPQSDQWSTTLLSTPRTDMGVVAVGNDVLFAGGLLENGMVTSTVDIYDVATGQMSSTALPYAADLVGAVADDGKAYFAGGGVHDFNDDATYFDNVSIFDPTTGAWSNQHLSDARSGVPATVLGNDIIFGGANLRPQAINRADVFDTTTGTWSILPEASAGDFAVTVGDTTLLAAGSYVGTTVDLYTASDVPLSATLLPTTPLKRSQARYEFSVAYHDASGIDAGTLGANNIVAIGTYNRTTPATLISTATGKHASTTVATYEVAGPQRRWTSNENATYSLQLQGGVVIGANGQSAPAAILGTFDVSIPVVQPSSPAVRRSTPMLSDSVNHPAATSVDGQAIFAGGFETQGTLSSAVDIYNETTGKWSTAALSEARAYLSAAAYGDDAFFAGGYYDEAEDVSDVMDIYDAQSGTWSSTLMPQAHVLPGVAAVSGQVIVAGGDLNTDVADIYNIATGRWSQSLLPQAIASGPGVSLGNKAYFVAGNGTLLEIYDGDTNSWSTVAAPLDADYGSSATSVGTDLLFTDDTGIFVYDTISGRWQPEHSVQTGMYMGATSDGSAAFFAGGQDAEGNAISNIYLYDTVNNIVGGPWGTQTLNPARSDVAATSINVTVLYAGGDTADVEADEDGFAIGPNISGDIDGTSQSVTVTITNSGDQDLDGHYTLDVYASTRRSIWKHSILVGSIAMDQPLKAGESTTVRLSIKFPAGTPAGNYYLIAATSKPGPILPFAIQTTPVSGA